MSTAGDWRSSVLSGTDVIRMETDLMQPSTTRKPLSTAIHEFIHETHPEPEGYWSPSPSVTPPLLSPSESPPFPWGIPFIGGGAACIGGATCTGGACTGGACGWTGAGAVGACRGIEVGRRRGVAVGTIRCGVVVGVS